MSKEATRIMEYYSSQLSWNKPIEQELLEFVRTMKRNMATQVGRGSFWGDKGRDREAQAYVNAYETVEKHILREMAIRNHD